MSPCAAALPALPLALPPASSPICGRPHTYLKQHLQLVHAQRLAVGADAARQVLRGWPGEQGRGGWVGARTLRSPLCRQAEQQQAARAALAPPPLPSRPRTCTCTLVRSPRRARRAACSSSSESPAPPAPPAGPPATASRRALTTSMMRSSMEPCQGHEEREREWAMRWVGEAHQHGAGVPSSQRRSKLPCPECELPQP